MMKVLEIVWYAVQIGIGYHLVLPVILYLATLLRSGQPGTGDSPAQADYAIIVTAYRYTESLPAVVDSLLRLNYDRYLVYLVADACSPEELRFLDPRVVVLLPEEILASNIRSHRYAMDRFQRRHDRVTIIDSDNIVHPEYLNELDKLFGRGYRAVQGIRLPRNLDTTLACLDAARDIYYHFYDAKILFRLGSSATLSGSGMAFATALYRECLDLAEPDGPGFDKVVQAEIVRRDLRIAFTDKALVYDAKTAKAEELVNQRSRWIGTWFKYHRFGFKLMGKGIMRFSWNQTLFGLILLRPPLFIFLILSALMLIVNWITGAPYTWVWAVALVLFICGFGIALLRSETDRRVYRSLLSIPRFMVLQVLALFRFLLKRRTPVSTKHS